MKTFNKIIASISLIGLVGCGGSSTDEDQIQPRIIGVSSNSICTTENNISVQWDKLKTVNASKLSEYQLFDNQCDPTQGPNSTGLPYDMAVPLFTDYATKYRFVFVPDTETATYDADEVFDFPIGTVLVKTFTLPLDTSDREIAKEEIIETRLLINRVTGWESLPYIWNADKSDAELDLIGSTQSVTIMHNESDLDFDYGVPTRQQCIKCHQIESEGSSVISPIGPKARYLNSDYEYEGGTQNQITKWAEAGILTGVPASTSDITSIPEFTDSTNLDTLTSNELEDMAAAWLDINCAHCHREGADAGNTNFNAVYGFAGSLATCNQPISYAGSGLSYIITPGNADSAILLQRMKAVPDGKGDQMPPIGRDLAHTEGINLVSAWIDSMSDVACSD